MRHCKNTIDWDPERHSKGLTCQEAQALLMFSWQSPYRFIKLARNVSNGNGARQRNHPMTLGPAVKPEHDATPSAGLFATKLEQMMYTDNTWHGLGENTHFLLTEQTLSPASSVVSHATCIGFYHSETCSSISVVLNIHVYQNWHCCTDRVELICQTTLQYSAWI